MLILNVVNKINFILFNYNKELYNIMENNINYNEGIIKYFYKPDKEYVEEDNFTNELERLSISELLNQAAEAYDNNKFKKAKELWQVDWQNSLQ